MSEANHSDHSGCCHVSRRSFMKKTAGAAVLGAALLSQTKKVKGAPRPGWQPSVIGPGGGVCPENQRCICPQKKRIWNEVARCRL
ncbi:twin-arginine translocation signal domain-containing protein [candidate division KSB1 bacterium]